MNNSISILLCAQLGIASFAFAADTNPAAESFKQKITERADSKINILTQFKTCVNAAQKAGDVAVCNEARKKARREKITELKKNRLENRKKRLNLQ